MTQARVLLGVVAVMVAAILAMWVFIPGESGSGREGRNAAIRETTPTRGESAKEATRARAPAVSGLRPRSSSETGSPAAKREHWEPIGIRIETATKAQISKNRKLDPRDRIFAVEDVWNKGVVNPAAHVDRDAGLVRVAFGFDPELFIATQERGYDKLGIGPQRFLLRAFDKNGRYLNHSITPKRYYPLDSDEAWIAEWERRTEIRTGRNPRLYPPEEFQFLDDASNQIVFSFTTKDAAFIETCEFGWSVQPIQNTRDKRFLVLYGGTKWQFTSN